MIHREWFSDFNAFKTSCTLLLTNEHKDLLWDLWQLLIYIKGDELA